jgi:hypothetical protein
MGAGMTTKQATSLTVPRILWASLACLVAAGCAQAEQVVWRLDNLETIGGHQVVIEGDPRLIDTTNGKAIEFDGVDDGLFLDVHPLAGQSAFTVEVIFKPYKGGAPEQRFFHMQEDPSQERVMFETRLVDGDLWFLDTFIFSGEQKIPLYAIDNKHEVDSWYHAAIVVDDDSFKHFVNGQLELSEPIQYEPQLAGRTSLGVRLNKVNWFKGAIRTVRFTSSALAPEHFLTAED